MHVTTLVDDTVGDLAIDRYHSSNVVAMVTLGMGTNVAYLGREYEVSKWNGPPPKSGSMVIDMGWGNFSSSHFPITEFDIYLDTESSNPDSTPMIREVVADVCDIVVDRGARIAGPGILDILKKLERVEAKQRTVVTVEGKLYQHYSLFRNYLHSGVWEMLESSEFADNIVIDNSNGGSRIGAIFLAASHSH
ncbi:hypothetical protein GIB67_037054 [Kingdonia uniflora]|uniref:Phosphotransferase n=1 Tax=Kingdonia uniflora TaxID=39325 RepID=A0A7J7LHL2_9MAGN|nr:hypothetical protein GIB67_037054 [Kingdonia uniflora]